MNKQQKNAAIMEQAFLETIVPEFPEQEGTPEQRIEFEDMMFDSYINSLTRAQKRKIKNKKFKFSEVVKRKLR